MVLCDSLCCGLYTVLVQSHELQFERLFHSYIPNTHLSADRPLRSYQRRTFTRIYTLLTTWLNGSSFITKCYLSLLLVIYSTQKFIPLVNSLKDVCDNNQLLIGGFGALNATDLLSEVCYQSMITRLISFKNYAKEENEFIDDWNGNQPLWVGEVRQDIIRGNAVFLTHSRLAQELLLVGRNFYLSDEKYGHQYLVNQIDKSHRFAKIIYRK